MSYVSGFILRLATVVIICLLTVLANQPDLQAQLIPTTTPLTPAAQASSEDDLDRPTLKHRSESIPETEQAARMADTSVQIATRPTGPTVAPGLTLPGTGMIWALDTFDGKPELVHLKYFPTNLDRHVASNIAKVNLAPFIAKSKATVEIRGAKSAVRLHVSTPTIFIRNMQSNNEDAAVDPSTLPTYSEWTLVKLEARGDKRLVSTISFTQYTGKASRSEAVAQIVADRIPQSTWWKVVPKEPLAPGEYGLVALPKGQSLFPTRIFDFAIDPGAPRNTVVAAPNNPPVQ